MTFLQIISEVKNKYNNESVIFEVLYLHSKIVKNKIQFVDNRNKQIDFNVKRFINGLDQYFIDQKPLSQITHTTKFYGLPLKVNKHIFEPRWETEQLCEIMISYLKDSRKLINVADLCCGTGAIGITLKKKCPWINVTAIDINSKAIVNTKTNAKLNDVIIHTITGDFYKTLTKLALKFDVIVCNPPYVPIEELNDEMSKYENKISFVNSKNPLFFYRTIINNAAKITNRKFIIGFEIGFNQKDRLIKILMDKKMNQYATFFKDYANLDRFLLINKTT